MYTYIYICLRCDESPDENDRFVQGKIRHENIERIYVYNLHGVKLDVHPDEIIYVYGYIPVVDGSVISLWLSNPCSSWWLTQPGHKPQLNWGKSRRKWNRTCPSLCARNKIIDKQKSDYRCRIDNYSIMYIHRNHYLRCCTMIAAFPTHSPCLTYNDQVTCLLLGILRTCLATQFKTCVVQGIGVANCLLSENENSVQFCGWRKTQCDTMCQEMSYSCPCSSKCKFDVLLLRSSSKHYSALYRDIFRSPGPYIFFPRPKQLITSCAKPY